MEKMTHYKSKIIFQVPDFCKAQNEDLHKNIIDYIRGIDPIGLQYTESQPFTSILQIIRKKDQ